MRFNGFCNAKTQINLAHSTSHTLPFENLKQVSALFPPPLLHPQPKRPVRGWAALRQSHFVNLACFDIALPRARADSYLTAARAVLLPVFVVHASRTHMNQLPPALTLPPSALLLAARRRRHLFNAGRDHLRQPLRRAAAVD